MFFRQAFASLLHLFAVFCFFVAGCFCMALFGSEQIRFQILEALFAHPEKCLEIGLCFFAITLLMALGFYALHRGKYVRIQMGKNKVDIDLALIRKALERCLKSQFLNQISLVGVGVRNKRSLEIEVETKRQDLMMELERELTCLFQQKLSLFSPFYLTVRSTAKERLDLSDSAP